MKNLLKKIVTVLGIITLISASLSLLPPKTVSAVGYQGPTKGSCPEFLGMTSWDCGLTITDDNSLKSGIWTIVTNISTDITVIATYLIIGYIIYGGYQYMLSSGDPGKVANGKKTLARAFIGLAIIMTANIIINTFRIVLLNEGGKFADCAQINAATNEITGCVDNPGEMVMKVINWVIGVSGLVAVIFVIIGGVSYMTSSGDPGKVKRAKDTIMYALIGLAIVALSFAISSFVSGMINNAKTDTSYHQTIISKEYLDEKIV